MVYWILSKCRVNFHDFCFISIENTAIAQSICKKNFHNSSKICEKREVLSPACVAFFIYDRSIIYSNRTIILFKYFNGTVSSMYN